MSLLLSRIFNTAYFLFLFAFATVASASTTSQLTPVNLQLFWYHQFEFAGFYAAIEQGYYQDKGIALTLKEYNPLKDSIESVIDGEAQFAIAGTDLIESYHQGKPVKLLASYFKRSPLSIITPLSTTSLNQLNNTTIFGNKNQLKQGSIRAMLNLYNTDIANIKTTMKGDPVELFKNNKVAGILAYKTNMPYTLNQEKIPFRLYDPSQFGMVSLDLNLFTTKHLAKADPELVSSFLKATNEGWRYAINNPEEIINLIKSKYNSQNKSIDALKFEAKETIKLIAPDLFEIGLIQESKLNLIAEESFHNLAINEIKPIDDFIFSPTIKNKINENLLALLTEEEQHYLLEKRTLKVDNNNSYPPFTYQNNGVPTGYSVELIEVMSRLLNIEIEYIKDKPWSEYVKMLQKKQLDILIHITDIESRHAFASFTKPHAEVLNYAIVRKNNNANILTLQDFKDQRIAIIEDFAINEDLFRLFPNNRYVTVSNTLEALQYISANKADVHIEAGALLDYHMSKSGVSDMRLVPISASLGLKKQQYSLATHKDNAILLSILEKTQKVIPEAEMLRLKRTWLGNTSSPKNIKKAFTTAELDFIDSNTVTLCRPQQSDGADKTIQIIDFITRNTSLKVELSPPLEWAESLVALQESRCDILATATPTDTRKTVMNFTPEYFRDKTVIITRKNTPPIEDISDHLDQTFTILKGLSVIDPLKYRFPNLQLIETTTTTEGISKVEQGEAKGFIYPHVLAKSLLSQYNLVNVKVNAQLREQFDDISAIATRKEDTLLTSIMAKSVFNVDKIALRNIITKPNANLNTQIVLSPEEESYISSHIITWCDSNHTDAWDELLTYLIRDTGMQVVKSTSTSWSEIINSLSSGKCDVLPELTETEKRRETMNFTRPFHQEERIIVTSEEQPFISNLLNYLDKEFVINRGDILYEQLLEDYPALKLRLVKYPNEGLQLVKNGQAFAYIGSISDTGNTISKFAIKGIKIAGSLPDKYNDIWSIATRKDDIILSRILNKMIDTSDGKRIREIISGNSSVTYQKGFDYTLFWQLLAFISIILTAIVFWIRHLSALNLQLEESNKKAEYAQQEIARQNHEILSTQKQLVQSEKMASLGTLTAGVAHEINNPTNFAHAAVFMMRKEVEEIKAFLVQLAGGSKADPAVLISFDEKFEKLIELTDTAKEGTNRIKVIVENLRSFAKLDDAKQANVNVSELINSTVQLVKTQFENISINVNMEYDPLIVCYPAKLNQVFMNIIVNACQAIEIKRKRYLLTDTTYKLEGEININSSSRDSYLVIGISDNGCGMDEKTKLKICEPFFSTKDVGDGTGLGMAISFGIIEEHNGLLKVTSFVDQGSMLSVYLPIIEPEIKL